MFSRVSELDEVSLLARPSVGPRGKDVGVPLQQVAQDGMIVIMTCLCAPLWLRWGCRVVTRGFLLCPFEVGFFRNRKGSSTRVGKQARENYKDHHHHDDRKDPSHKEWTAHGKDRRGDERVNGSVGQSVSAHYGGRVGLHGGPNRASNNEQIRRPPTLGGRI